MLALKGNRPGFCLPCSYMLDTRPRLDPQAVAAAVVVAGAAAAAVAGSGTAVSAGAAAVVAAAAAGTGTAASGDGGAVVAYENTIYTSITMEPLPKFP